MCGICAYNGSQLAMPILLTMLERSTHRGYDSLGIGIVESPNSIRIEKDIGKFSEVVNKINKDSENAKRGIGHTRWATHGSVTKENAHPHKDCSGSWAVAHNGIIENHESLREELISRGHKFHSQTDTEVIPHLLEENYCGSVEKAVYKTLKILKGSYAIAVIESDEEKIVVSKYESPLLVGKGEFGCFAASDPQPFAGFVKEFTPLNDGEMATITRENIFLYKDGAQLSRQLEYFPWSQISVTKEGFPYFMAKEIMGQPQIIENNIRNPKLEKIREFSDALLKTKKLPYFVGNGTSYHACKIMKHLLRNYLGMESDAVHASAFKWNNSIDNDSVVIALSQSGETRDVLDAGKVAKEKGAKFYSIVNVPGSTLTRESDLVLLLDAGPENGVAATKSYTAQLLSLYQVAAELGRNLNKDFSDRLIEGFEVLPEKMKKATRIDGTINKIAETIKDAEHAFYLGKGINEATAMEGALKLKEISYIHAESFEAGDYRHGSLALAESKTPVIWIGQDDGSLELIRSNVSEAVARDAYAVGLVPESYNLHSSYFQKLKSQKFANDIITYPNVDYLLTPFVTIIPLQKLAYETTLLRKYDPDYPRNLAKTITTR